LNKSPQLDAKPPDKTTWLNCNVLGVGLTSLLSDASHEMATAVLPGFISALGISAAALGTHFRYGRFCPHTNDSGCDPVARSNLRVRHAAQIAALLYVGHVVYAAYSYPVGALSYRVGRRGLLSIGYFAGALAAMGFAAAFEWKLAVIIYIYLLSLFGISGFSIAAVDALEGVLTADLVAEDRTRGTAYGVLGAVNGAGDLVASILVGALWTAVSPVIAFACAAFLMSLGGVVIFWVR
jgi:MFS family permease